MQRKKTVGWISAAVAALCFVTFAVMLMAPTAVKAASFADVGEDEWFAEARPYYQLDNALKVGPEFSLSGGSDYLHARAGVSVLGWEFDLPWVGRFWVGGSAGALWDTDSTRV